jgi:S-adenosylmethionine decarboxylase
MALHHQGSEWIVEAYGCDPVRLADPASLQALFDAIIADLALHPVAPAQWHQFPAPGGITGMVMLAESHLTVHTFPEHGSACINLFCCTPRAEWPWRARLHEQLGADEVRCRMVPREYVSPLAITPDIR